MKVLLLAYDFPPLISIGGQRPYSWFKYFPEYGIETTVITRKWSDSINSPVDYVKATEGMATEVEESKLGRVYRTSFSPNFRDRMLLKYGLNRYSGLRKLITYLLSYLEFVFFCFDAKKNIYKEAKKFLTANKVDVIVATGEPFILFKHASRLSAEFDIPWIADYRDGWTNNQGGYRNSILYKMQTWFYKNREQEYLQNAALVTTPAPGYARDLQKIHPKKKVLVAYNGYNNDAFDDEILPMPDNSVFTISYAGTLYPYQKMELFLDGLSGFIEKQGAIKDLKVSFLGALHNAELKERVLSYAPHLSEYFEFTPRIPYNEAMKKMSTSHILLLLTAKSVNSLATKVFDYLALKREIMLVENDEGVMEGIIRKSNAGVALNTKSEITAFISKKYDDFKAGRSAVNNTIDYQFYSRRVQAEIYAGILKGVIKHTA